jgi:MFS transporter, SP family, general alpha glucoside:H+ symporter
MNMASSPIPDKNEVDTSIASIPDTESANKDHEDPHANLRLKEAIRQYPRLVMYIGGLSTFIILVGYDLAAIGAVASLDPFQRDFGVFDEIKDGEEKYIIPAIWLSLWQAFPSVGQLFAAIAAGPLQDTIGRKKCLVIGSWITIVAVLVEFLAYKGTTQDAMRGILLLGKIIQGASLALIKMTLLTYISELSPTCLRGASMAIFPSLNLVGQFLGAVVVFALNGMETETGYLIAIGLQWFFSIVPFVAAYTIPESPTYLLRINKPEEAHASIVKLFAPQNDPDVVLKKIRISLEEEERTSKETTYAQCFRGSNLRRTLIIIFANFLPPMFGLPLLTSASYFLQQVGMTSKYSLIFLIIGIVVGFIANTGSLWTLTHLGRRNLTIWTLVGAAIIWAAMGVAGCFDNERIVRWLTAAFAMIVICIAGVGVWPTSYTITSETSALRLRAKSQSIGGVSAYVVSIFTNFVLPFLYNPDAANLKAKTGFVFTGTSLLAAAITWMCVPEMKGKSTVEIDHMFEEKVPARKSANWKDPSAEARAVNI